MTAIPRLPDGFEWLHERGTTAAVRSAVKERLVALGILDRRRFAERIRAGEGVGGGRGHAAIVEIESGERLVLRTCRRGGWARWLGGRYLAGARPIEELCVSETARAANVPVPEVLAAVTWRRGPFYSGGVVTRAVAGSVPLDEWLRGRGGASRELLVALREAFSKLFAAGIHHRDLHAGNVLVQESEAGLRVFLIDFDKARHVAVLTEALRNEMLFRFNRALVKRGLAPGAVSLAERVRFCRDLGVAADPDAMRRFLRSCRAHLNRHAWRYRD